MDHGSEEETESQGHTRWSMPRLPYLDQIQIGAEGLLLDDASRIHSLQPPRVIESTAAAATTCLSRFPSALTVTVSSGHSLPALTLRAVASTFQAGTCEV